MRSRRTPGKDGRPEEREVYSSDSSKRSFLYCICIPLMVVLTAGLLLALVPTLLTLSGTSVAFQVGGLRVHSARLSLTPNQISQENVDDLEKKPAIAVLSEKGALEEEVIEKQKTADTEEGVFEEEFEDRLLSDNFTSGKGKAASGRFSSKATGKSALELGSIQEAAEGDSEEDVAAIVPNSKCDIFQGKWVKDPTPPPYSSESCDFISSHQNCQGNGRPDSGYEQWRWQPTECDLPRFDPHEFFRIMRRKTIAFIGDSVARNHMESLLCLLSQVEVPLNRGSRLLQRFTFHRKRLTVVRLWSAWLTAEHPRNPFPQVPATVATLHLDRADERWLKLLPGFDAVVLSTGHWWVKPAAFIKEGKIVGTQLWPNSNTSNEVSNVEAFKISLPNVLRSIGNVRDYKGLTIFRTWSPDHYIGGEWNTGGSCADQTHPMQPSQVSHTSFGEAIRNHQLAAFDEVAGGELANGSKLQLMDVTPSSDLRSDGHPGPFRNGSVAAAAAAKNGPKPELPPPQDCLHWCMPGPVDTWNQFLMEMLRKEFDTVG